VRDACTAAFDLPARGAEYELWAVRGLSEIALGCVLLDDSEVTGEFDEAVRAAGLSAGGPAALRLRRLRALLGPVPPGYPSGTSPPRGLAAVLEPETWRAAEALCAFATDLMDRPGGGRAEPLAVATAEALRWGARLRPSPGPAAHLWTPPSPGPGLVWRSWMRLAGPVTAIVDRPPLEPPLRRLLWRGLHDGAHLDHMAALAGAPETAHTAPLPIEFGTGLLAAESYAMAVEILAAAERSLDRALTEEICRGLLERVGRLPGAAARPALARVAVRPNPEYGMLPTLAAAH
jgi:hypothetical protein